MPSSHTQPLVCYKLGPDELLINCPYDPTHLVRTTRYSVHLLRCRERYMFEQAKKGYLLDVFPCKYNTGHQVPAQELDYHLNICPDRIRRTGAATLSEED